MPLKAIYLFLLTDRSEHNEKELLLRIAEGDEAAFETLFHLYLPKLTPFAWKLTRDWEAAREIVQETFLRIWVSRDQLTHVETPAAYIFTITSNQCYKYLKKQMQLQQFAANTDEKDDPHATINLLELKRLINKAVDNLSEQRRKVFILSREKGLTIPEIANELKLSPNTVKNTLVSALQAIREYLQSQGYLLPAILILAVL